VTEQERETAGAVRSAHVAHFFPTDWTQTAQRASGALERADREKAAPQLLVTVPDPAAALALAREIRTLAASAGLRILPVTSAARATRLLRSEPAHVVVGTPSALAELMAASALKVDAVQTVFLAAADEYEGNAEALGTLMAETPRGSARILSAAAETPTVEKLLERYLHKARKVVAPIPGAVTTASGTPPTIYLRTVAAGHVLAPLAELMDELDPPSCAIVAPDARTESQARTALEALGYATDALVTVTRGPVTPHTALVIFAGLPDQTALAAALDAHPARLVALLPARQRSPFEAIARGVVLMPYELSRAARAAKTSEDRVRSNLRAVLAGGIPSREVLTLEPLLGDFDAIEIAAAALRLWEAAEAMSLSAKMAGREEVRQEIKAAKAAAAAAAEEAAPKGRSFDRGAPRSGDRNRSSGDRPFSKGPRTDRPPRSDSAPRSFDRAPRSGGAAGSDAAPRPDREPRGPYVPRTDRSARPGDRPYTGGPKGGASKGRPPRRDK
jgi:ATP-dependent RNA helicase DeaD